MFNLFLFLSVPLSSSTPVPSSQKLIIPNLSTSVSAAARDLFQEVEAENPSDNVIISPLSIHLAMSLLYHGAQNRSKQQLEKVLSLEHISDQIVSEESRNLLLSYIKLKSNLQTKIELANVIFADNTVDIKTPYQEGLNSSFLTSARRVDYSNPTKSSDTINEWVANKTSNLITELITPEAIDPSSTRMMLLNAVYFKANWRFPFPKFDTFTAPFTVSRNAYVNTKMMKLTEIIAYNYDKDLQAHIISLPYENPNFDMLVILPDDNVDVDVLSSRMRGVNFNDMNARLSLEEIALEMPKFKLGFKTQLVSAFKKLGVSDIFGSAADLTGITDESLYVSDILHETKIEVNEEGSEAAGITGIILDLRTAGGSTPQLLRINRPFMFVIQDLENRIPLFMGKIINPSEEEPITNEISNDKEFLASSDIEYEEISSPIAVRNENPSSFTDPEEKAHLKNNPQDSVNRCWEYDPTKPNNIKFPCPGDTQPIEDYKKKHGDPSRHGVNGEKASLMQ